MSSNKMWGGRFESGPADIMREITPSIDFDKRLAAEDLAGSRAHCRMLAAEGIISKDDGQAILDGLTQIEKEIAAGTFVFKRELEDIHLNIEARLAELIGPAAGRLHTARSRNDQVVTDFAAYATAEGFYHLRVPIGAHRPIVAIQLGRLCEWVQVEELGYCPIAAMAKGRTATTVTAEASVDAMETMAPGLYRAAPTGLLIAPPPPGDEPMVLSLVFRPVVARKPAVELRVAA